MIHWMIKKTTQVEVREMGREVINRLVERITKCEVSEGVRERGDGG